MQHTRWLRRNLNAYSIVTAFPVDPRGRGRADNARQLVWSKRAKNSQPPLAESSTFPAEAQSAKAVLEDPLTAHGGHTIKSLLLLSPERKRELKAQIAADPQTVL